MSNTKDYEYLEWFQKIENETIQTKYLSVESVPHSFEYEMFPHRLWLITETAAPFSPGDKLTNIDTSWRHHHHGWWRWRPQTFSTFTPTIASPSPPMGDNGW